MTSTHVLLGMGEIQAAQGESEFSVLGVGSGVVIAAYDKANGIGACAHIILPEPPPDYDRDRPGKYAPVGVKEMLRNMAELGATEGNIRTALIGGAGMVHTTCSMPGGVGDLGKRNVSAVLNALRLSGIKCDAQDVGGAFGRSMTLCLKSGTVTVRTGQQSEHVLCRLGG